MRGTMDATESFDNMLAMWSPPLLSADQEILPTKELNDSRVRDLTRTDAYVSSVVQTHKDGVVGDNFTLNAIPNYKALGKTREWAIAFAEQVEAEFSVWASSVHDGPDASAKLNLTGILRLATASFLASGEVAGSIEWVERKGRTYATAINLIDMDRLHTPSKYTNDPKVVNGVRMDKYGAPLGYYVHERKRSDHFYYDTLKYKYVKRTKPWGRVQFFHIFDPIRPEQTRGVSELVSALKQVKIMSKFRDVTLQNAIVGGMFAATIESDLPTEAVYNALGGEGGVAGNVNQYSAQFLKGIAQYTKNTPLTMDGVRIPHLYPGTKLSMNPVSTPGAIGQDFEDSLLRYLAASTGVSFEQISRDYSKTNYSSIRAALLEVRRGMKARKRLIADQIASTGYVAWLEEAIYAGVINADGIDLRAGQNMKHLARAEWIGPAQGQIDTLKETQAAVLRLKFGLTTQKAEAAVFGQDWRDNNEQLEIEKKDRVKRDIEWMEAKSIDAASGSPQQARDPRNANSTQGKG